MVYRCTPSGQFTKYYPSSDGRGHSPLKVFRSWSFQDGQLRSEKPVGLYSPPHGSAISVTPG